mmetsp:Transcript_20887/g.35907  ORF Transcript_20887/g.35907 Transcript_20887/m.35907 type:complete len:238 (-) Transcript_20887:592-1305(-)
MQTRISHRLHRSGRHTEEETHSQGPLRTQGQEGPVESKGGSGHGAQEGSGGVDSRTCAIRTGSSGTLARSQCLERQRRMRQFVVRHGTMVHAARRVHPGHYLRGTGRRRVIGWRHPQQPDHIGAHAGSLGHGGMVVVCSRHGGLSLPRPHARHPRHGESRPPRNPPSQSQEVARDYRWPESRILVQCQRRREGGVLRTCGHGRTRGGDADLLRRARGRGDRGRCQVHARGWCTRRGR